MFCYKFLAMETVFNKIQTLNVFCQNSLAIICYEMIICPKCFESILAEKK